MKTLIITGGDISSEVLERIYDETIEYVIAVDGGLTAIHKYNSKTIEDSPATNGDRHQLFQAESNGDRQQFLLKTRSNSKVIRLNYIIGDFDTVSQDLIDIYKQKNITIGEFPAEKDYTDTHLALLKAIEMGADSIIILGATGSRLDHTLANIGILGVALDHKLPCKIIDSNNEIQLIDQEIILSKKEGYYVSILPVTATISGVTLQGFKFPLNNATIKHGETVGISNQILEDKGTIQITEGRALIIQAKD